MIRLGAEAKESPEEVLAEAAAFFGPDGVGLAPRQRTEQAISFQGGGGYVTISATRSEDDKNTEVILEGREWDYQIRQFVRELENA